jgi:hypothetical protein
MTADRTSLLTSGLIAAQAQELPPARPLDGATAGLPPYLEVGEYVPQPPGPDWPQPAPDPPVFILLGSPAWPGAAAVLDTQYQKVPIGGTGQILTVQADGSVNWSNAAAGFTNPMSAVGDLIVGGTAGAATRFPIGAAGQVLTVSGGTVSWAAPVTGFTNPMTTPNDMILGTTAGAASRLPVGTVNQLLCVNFLGNVVWGQGAMVVNGDLMYGQTSGSPARLAIGGVGQVLTVNGAGTAPVWQNAAAGFTNPMTGKGDMIVGGGSGAATRLPSGAASPVPQQLAMLATTLEPGWITPPVLIVPPSGDTSGAADVTALNGAFTALTGAGVGGTVQLLPGDYYINAQVTVPQQSVAGTGGYPCSLIGSRGATVIHHVGGATGLYVHRSGSLGPVQNMQPTGIVVAGRIADFILDGTLAPTGAIGMDCGDAWGMHVDVQITNYYTAGAIGFNQVNRVMFTEKCYFKLVTTNCTNHIVVDSISSQLSHEYNDWDIYQFALGASATALNAGQISMTFQNGAYQGGGRLFMRGNHGGGGTGPPGELLLVTGQDGSSNYSKLFNVEFDIVVESSSSSNQPSVLVLGGPNNTFGGHGMIVPQLGGWQPSILNGGQFKFSGRLHSDTGLTSVTAPGVPAANATITNNQIDSVVTVTGGTAVNINLNGVATGSATGPVFVRADAQIGLGNYTGVPTWTWAPANL